MSIDPITDERHVAAVWGPGVRVDGPRRRPGTKKPPLTRRRRISGIPGQARNDGWVAKDFILIDRHDRPPGRTAFQSVTSPEFVILFAKDALL